MYIHMYMYQGARLLACGEGGRGAWPWPRTRFRGLAQPPSARPVARETRGYEPVALHALPYTRLYQGG